MSEHAQDTLTFSVVVWMALALPILVMTLVRTAPYGRFRREGWGPAVPAIAAWMGMESVSLVLFNVFFFVGQRFDDPARWVFWALFTVHYANRSIVYPLRSRMAGTTMPLSVMLMAIAFNSVNASTNGAFLFLGDRAYGAEWLSDPRFLGGVAVFAIGMAINLRADAVLRALRAPGEHGYQIPQGGLYRWVTCPNYLGEMLEWLGFALATWSLPALAFALWTIANLAPRARAHHRWYRERFPDYPRERRALVPFVW
jgi:protein-S-isoprenylcysteine O-methyltransferase Ste14